MQLLDFHISRHVLFLFLYCCIYAIQIQCVSDSKVLVAMVDNRPLDSMNSSDYGWYSFVINYAYAHLHDYDFLVFSTNDTNFITNVEMKFSIDRPSLLNSNMQKGWASWSKLQPSVFHPRLLQFRASPWAKLPIFWHICRHGWHGKLYDHILYLDTDVVINPKFHSRSLEHSFLSWSLPKIITR